MTCAKHSADLARCDTGGEITNERDSDDTDVLIQTEPEVSVQVKRCSKCLIEEDIRDVLYDRCVVYKDISGHELNDDDVSPSPSNIEERHCVSRRSGRVDPPTAIRRDIKEHANNKTEYSYPHEEGKRSRNLSEGSYFSAKKVTETTSGDDICCDVDVPSDRVCPSRLRGCHGRFSVDNITNVSAIRCLRWRMRRNALCDPLRLLLPQYVRERLERDNERRRTSMARKVSQFMTVNFDLDRDEDLI